MKAHVNPDKELAKIIRQAIKDNQGYCPCVLDSIGKEEYKCICQDFLNNVSVGETCHCGLYIKDEQ